MLLKMAFPSADLFVNHPFGLVVPIYFCLRWGRIDDHRSSMNLNSALHHGAENRFHHWPLVNSSALHLQLHSSLPQCEYPLQGWN